MSVATEEAAPTAGADDTSGGSVRLIGDPAAIPTKLRGDGHANNPDAEYCRICEQQIGEAAVVTEKVPSTLARLLLEDGTAIDVADDLAIGRSPATDLRMDTLTVGGRQVSRQHLMLEARGWEVYISDCDSTNGTFLARQGEKGRRRVPVDDAMRLRIGDAIHFGSRQALVVRPTDT